MKKIILGALGLALLSSCADKAAYTITGIVTGDVVKDSSYVYMKKLNYEEKMLKTIDSTLILNGKFTFEGTKEIPEMAFMEFAKGGRPYRQIIVIEPGKIDLTIGETVSTKGTANNNLYNEFSNNAADKGMEINKVYEQYMQLKNQDEKANAEKLEALEKEINEKIDASRAAQQDFIVANITNIVGQFMYYDNYKAMELKNSKELYEKMPIDVKETPQAKEAVEFFAKKETLEIGQKFTDVKGLTPEGKEVKLSDYAGKGKIVLIDFWASWCGPCIAEMPHVVKAYKEYQKKGFEIVGISLDQDKEKWEKAIKDLGITWVQFSNLKGWKDDASQAYLVNSIPHTILLDKDGIIIEKDLRGDDLSKKIGELLK